MMQQKSYKIAFMLAVVFHLIVMGGLFSSPSHKRPVLVAHAKTDLLPPSPTHDRQDEQVIQAVSVDENEVMETVKQLKAEKQRKEKAEQQHQLALKQQAELAKQERIKEQKRIERLKQEANKLAKEQEKRISAEKKQLKQLEQQKHQEAKRIAELKKKKEALKKKQAEEAKQLAEKKRKQAEQAKAAAAREKQLEADRLAKEAARRSQVAGEVNKYKALIINAISRRWILPDNVDSSLSSQFRIRLAPTGTVLEVSLTRSSGNPILDRSAQSAIYKASPLPVPEDPDAFKVFRDISLTVRPENARG
jgi:colicin import membrane protein